MRRRLRYLVHRSARSAAVGVALIGFLAAQVGFPMPVRPIADSSNSSASHVRPCGCPVAGESQKCCCCSTKAPAAPASSCCQTHEAEKPGPEDCSPSHETTHPAADSSPRVDWVIGSLLQQCHGIQTGWVALGAVLPPSDRVRLPIDFRPPEYIPFTADVASTRSAPPLDPPPRIPSV